jgi:hypothetical protein
MTYISGLICVPVATLRGGLKGCPVGAAMPLKDWLEENQCLATLNPQTTIVSTAFFAMKGELASLSISAWEGLRGLSSM